MIRKVIKVFKILVGLYLIIYLAGYFFQEHFIFLPQKLDKNYPFNFNGDFEEMYFEASDGILLNGLLFKTNPSKGLIFYLHGNAGSLSSWGNVAKTYTALNYDVFILDYRSYGKSEGSITGPEQLFRDNQVVYDALNKKYSEEEIIILGYSIGTGLAAKLASENNPRQLILQAPYYNLTEEMHQRFPFLPHSILKYKFATNEYLKSCDMPITIFHGNSDRVISYKSSLKLREEFPNKIKLITLNGQGHNGMIDNPEYKRQLVSILR